jgi:hypothetical protein
MKECSLCKTHKPLSAFNKNAAYKEGHYKHCRSCHYEVYGRSTHLFRTYGITPDDYNILLEKQQYKCFACTKEHSESKKERLYVDHCHTTGRIRGLLCQGCNFAIGAVKDNIETLKNLIKYLER